MNKWTWKDTRSNDGRGVAYCGCAVAFFLCIHAVVIVAGKVQTNFSHQTDPWGRKPGIPLFSFFLLAFRTRGDLWRVMLWLKVLRTWALIGRSLLACLLTFSISSTELKFRRSVFSFQLGPSLLSWRIVQRAHSESGSQWSISSDPSVANFDAGTCATEAFNPFKAYDASLCNFFSLSFSTNSFHFILDFLWQRDLLCFSVLLLLALFLFLLFIYNYNFFAAGLLISYSTDIIKRIFQIWQTALRHLFLLMLCTSLFALMHLLFHLPLCCP